MQITIIRHGETKANEDDKLQGQLPGELSERGLSQSHALACKLSKNKFDIIIATDLKRGLTTAKIIAQYHNVPLITDKLLRERCFGILEGTSRTKFYSHERSLPDPYSHRPEKGESFYDLYDRAKLFVDKIKKQYNGKSLLIVSHGDFVRMCLGVFQELSVEKASKLRQANGCINILRFENNLQWHLIKFNDIQHLKPNLISNNKTDL